MNLKEEILNLLKENQDFVSAMDTKSKEEQEQIYSEIISLADSFQGQIGDLQSVLSQNNI